MKNLIVHVADMKVTEEGGVGRVTWHWKKTFEERGYKFVHIGLAEVGAIAHKSLFPYAAFRYYNTLKEKARAFLVHESAAWPFLNSQVPVIVFSHGLERRAWDVELKARQISGKKISLKTRLFYPLWRLIPCDLGMRKATELFLFNQEDATFAQNYYGRKPREIFVLKNGVYPSHLTEKDQPTDSKTILFLASWIERKGIKTLLEAAQILSDRGWYLKWLLVGTCAGSEIIVNQWPSHLRSSVEVLPYFLRSEEDTIFARSNIFVLPSFYEGQSLSLLQAMESARCCISTNICGQRDVIQNGHNGLLHEPGNAQQLASLIEECLNDEDLRLALGKNAKLSMKDRHWKVVSNEIVDRLEEVCLEWESIRGVA